MDARGSYAGSTFDVGLRETVNKYPGLVTGATIGVILLTIIYIVWQFFGA